MKDPFRCRICGNHESNRTFNVREMMQGSRECFPYFQCGQCDTVQIVSIPGDLSPYYPDSYYSFDERHDSPAKRLILYLRDSYALRRSPRVAAILLNRYPRPDLQSLRHLNLSFAARILDVGAGSGSLLRTLRNLGYRNLLGIDPFLPASSVSEPGGVRVISAGIDSVEGTWDLIMFHHSFEHLIDPMSGLLAARRLVSPSGVVLVRTPVSSSDAFRKYGTNWVQLDAPRHLHILSIQALREVASRAGFQVSTVIYDSSEFQFWGSEQYARDIALLSPRSYAVSKRSSVFSSRDMRVFRRTAGAKNRAMTGDQVVAYLRPT